MSDTTRKSTHLIFAPNDKTGVCDSCLDFNDSLYEYRINKKRTEKRCAKCIADALDASFEILEVEKV